MPMWCRWAASQVTADLARMLAAPLSAAERIKTLYGAALGDMEVGADVVAVPQMGEDGEENAPARAALHADAHHPGAAGRDFRPKCRRACAPRGYDVAAGRGPCSPAAPASLPACASWPAACSTSRCGSAGRKAFPGLPASSAGPDYATAIGLLMAGATMPPDVLNPELASLPAERGAKGWLSG